MFTSISNDSGSSGSDEITTDTTLTLSGTATPSSVVTIHRAGVGDIGTTTANGGGAWSFDYTGTALPEGTHAFTATATLNSSTSPASAPFLVVVDSTAPAVAVSVDATTSSLKPVVRVVATDANGLANGTAVALDVDLDNDGNFTDGGEPDHTTGTLTDNVALLTLSSAVSVGTIRIRARVTDKAGNQGTSSAQTVVVSSSGSSWTISDALPTTNAVLGTGSR